MRGIQTRTKSEVDPKTVTKLVHRSDETTEEENDNKLKRFLKIKCTGNGQSKLFQVCFYLLYVTP